MKVLATLAFIVGAAAVAVAQDAVPDLKGTWSGPMNSIVFGNNPHHPGQHTVDHPPRAVNITFTLQIEGQNGRVAWGKSWSDAKNKEPFALAIAADGKTIAGSDTDGSIQMTLLAPDRIDLCYTHTGQSPSKSIVASCGVISRGR